MHVGNVSVVRRTRHPKGSKGCIPGDRRKKKRTYTSTVKRRENYLQKEVFPWGGKRSEGSLSGGMIEMKGHGPRNGAKKRAGLCTESFGEMLTKGGVLGGGME